MSLPKFSDNGNIPSRDEVINQIISSIAMEELGLSHIINAEGEKLQYALGTIEGVPGPEAPLTIEDILKLNESIHQTLNGTMMNQFFLKEKLATALSASVMQGPTGPPGPQGPSTIDVDPEVDNLDPGEPPYVLNEGTLEDVVLKFGIPRGATGEQGSKGDTGSVGTILNSYPTLSDLETNHPIGNQGDAYLVGDGGLYVWDTEPGEWKNVGNLSGPEGPAWEPGQEIFSVSGTSGTQDVTYEGDLTFESDTLDITVESGPVVKIENPAANAGAIIPFASGKSLVIDTVTIGGLRNTAAVIGFGNGGTFDVPSDLGESIVLPVGDLIDCYNAFTMPVSGKITSMTFYCSAFAPSGIPGATNVITARLYYSDTPDNVFQPLDGAVVSVQIENGVPTGGTAYRAEVNDALSIPVNKGVRILFLIDTQTAPGYLAVTSIRAHWGGSIKIK